jgi:ADP-dependent NAD(P)H-hydrate dehydratase / NAD(P)H-hydrate epimerase
MMKKLDENLNIEIKEIDGSILKKIFKKRPMDSRKYDYGLLVVIGGSDFYSGSPCLSAMAAFKSGVDMVRIIAPQRAADIIASFSPILSAYPLEGKRINKSHLSTLLAMIESANQVSRGNVAVVLGGGVGRSDETQEVIIDLISEINVPIVIDADAIYAIKKNKEILISKDCLITPHYYEFFSLTGRDIFNLSFQEKVKAVKEEAFNLKSTIILKGEVDIISDGESTAINKVGSPYLTVGGCGDTLAGIAGALISRKISLFEAAEAAAYINSSAGKKMAERLKDSMTAIDLIDGITEIINF